MRSYSSQEKSKTVSIILGVVVIVAVAWVVMYLRHYQETVVFAATSPSTHVNLQETFSQYEKHVKPILEKKCFACHTDTKDRPFFYYIPVVDSITKPYTENQILMGRRNFDFSKGMPKGRFGAAMEMVLRLREAIEDKTMPPLAYSVIRPYNLLNASEEKIILDWAEKAAEAMIAELVNMKGENQETPINTSNEFGEVLANHIISACPMVDPGNVQAHDQCADKLAESSLFKARVNDPFLWGGQKAEGDYNTYHTHVTRFNPLLFRKFYLSLFMFKGSFQVDHDGDLSAYRFPVQFRDQLPDGEYPYPFWHSKNKWKKYNESAELILLVRRGKIMGAFRSAKKNSSLPDYGERPWNGDWLWNVAGNQVLQPRVTNYNALFSSNNPYVEDLEDAYWKLSLGFRSENCLVCHSPSNSQSMKMLEILTSPGHALGARSRLLAVFEDNSMPPVSGIQSAETRKILSKLTRRFKDLGDKALAYEGENITDSLARPTFF